MEIIFILAILVFLDRSKELVSKDKKKDLHLPLRELLMCLDIDHGHVAYTAMTSHTS